MKIEVLDSQPDAKLNAALEKFESQFRYPLGGDSWFRISHGEDYTRFFRAIGDARCFVAVQDATVIGTITSTICQLRQPAGQFHRAGYISDLKVAEPATGRTVLRLLQAATEWTLTQPTPAFCVVMDGTAKSPTNYTGRLDIPAFEELGQLMILRIPSAAGDGEAGLHVVPQDTKVSQDINTVRELYQKLTADRFATAGGNPTIRSRMPPRGLIQANGNACGILEDTRRCKRLFRSDGGEMISAHLSCFGYRSIEDAAQLILTASQECDQLAIPALFVCVSAPEADSLVRLLPGRRLVQAPATVFGYAFDQRGRWSINTAEI